MPFSTKSIHLRNYLKPCVCMSTLEIWNGLTVTTMADLFGDPSLFEEFDKEQLPCDKILRQKFKKDVATIQNTSVDEGSDSAFSAEFHVGSGSSSDSESETDFIENEDSDHGGGITGVGDILHKLNNESKQIGKDLSQVKDGNSNVDSERYLKMKQQVEDLMGENILF